MREVSKVPVLSAAARRLATQDEIAEITTIAGRAVAVLLAGAPRFLSRHEPTGAIAYSRESPLT